MTRERLYSLVPIFLIAATLLGIILHRSGLLQPIEGFVVSITRPVQEAASGVVDQFGEIAQTARDLRDLRRRNEELETENARLVLENVRLREIMVEAGLLRDLLNFVQDNPAFGYQGAHVLARVISREPTNIQRYITLDVGRESGIERNMPVATDRGLVGRISAVGEGWSRVLLLIDSSSSVHALTQSTRASGLVEGQPDGTLKMRAIPQADTVSVGDIVFTSGLGGNFPRQIPIGQVTEVERKDYELYQVAIVQPTVDFDHLEVVLVLTEFQAVDPLQEIEDEDGQ
ncbi:MAG: rod shape-determining protein MreC [Anaerolineae bacterium]|nr:rod shape-determining protein MreC [Anaerolineae bacterium]